MTPFDVITGRAAPMDEADIDTDIIFPARFLLHTERDGLGRFAFFDRRFAADGSERDDFVLNRDPWRQAGILVAGANFGCGSSREQAPWALAGLGLRCIVAPSFGDIFQANCVANGVLPVALPVADWRHVLRLARLGCLIRVDLTTCTIAPVDVRQGEPTAFELAPRQRLALLTGLDETGLILHQESARISAFEQRQRERMPWLFNAHPAHPL
jgi:3-isopropylmalate dehydratase small subunit